MVWSTSTSIPSCGSPGRSPWSVLERPSWRRSASFSPAHAAWVIEGCYGELVEAASSRCTELVFLNPGLETCLAHNRRRPWEPEKYASLEKQNEMLDALQAWVEAYYTRDDPWSYEAHRRVFDAHPGAKVEHTTEVSHPLDP